MRKIFVVMYILCLFVDDCYCIQQIPSVSAPKAVYSHKQYAKIPDSQINNYEYLYELVYSDRDIRNIAALGGVNCPKSVGYFTKHDCEALVAECKQEGMTPSCREIKNPNYKNPSQNGSRNSGENYENRTENEQKYSYSPESQANKSIKTKSQLATTEQKLKDRMVTNNTLELKKVDYDALKKKSQPECTKFVRYRSVRLFKLGKMLENKGNLINQQQKTLETQKGEQTSWNKARNDAWLDMAIETSKILGGLYAEKIKKFDLNTPYNYGLNAKDSYDILADKASGQTDSNYGSFYRSLNIGINTLNYVTTYASLSPALSPLIKFGTPLGYIDAALKFGPIVTDAFALRYINAEIGASTKATEHEEINAAQLQNKIESWQNEKSDLESCGENCDAIKGVIVKYRPDLSESLDQYVDTY